MHGQQPAPTLAVQNQLQSHKVSLGTLSTKLRIVRTIRVSRTATIAAVVIRELVSDVDFHIQTANSAALFLDHAIKVTFSAPISTLANASF